MQRSTRTKLVDIVPKEPKKLHDSVAVWSEMKDLAIKHRCLSLG